MTQTIEHHRRTGSIVRLCCLTSWPRHRPGVPAFYKWAPPSRCCCGNAFGSVVLGAAVLPWALLKGVLVASPAAMFGFVGGVLLIPTSLARTALCLGLGVVSSSTMSWKVRAQCSQHQTNMPGNASLSLSLSLSLSFFVCVCVCVCVCLPLSLSLCLSLSLSLFLSLCVSLSPYVCVSASVSVSISISLSLSLPPPPPPPPFLIMQLHRNGSPQGMT